MITTLHEVVREGRTEARREEGIQRLKVMEDYDWMSRFLQIEGVAEKKLTASFHDFVHECLFF